MEEFVKIIEQYITEYCKTDTSLAEKIKESKKTYKGCANYIIAEVKKKSKGNMGVLADAECYGLMVHYFDEDSIKEEQPKAVTPVKVATSKPTPTKSKEQPKTTKQEHPQEEKKEEKVLSIKPTKPIKKKEEELTLSLF